jgi:UDP-GlcNAc:undecaprenyl-phosphate GlcNAc-1-phosphate transferase
MFYLFTVVLSYLSILVLIKYSQKLKLEDSPTFRSSHVKITPSGAGIGFVFSLLLALVIFKYDLILQNIYMFVAVFIVFIVGIYDDVKDVVPKIKFLSISVATIFLYFNGIHIDSLGQYFEFELSLYYLSIPFTIFAVVGFTNAFNLVDGLDNLAGGIALVILMTFAYIGFQFNDNFILILSLATIASILPFIYFNYPPAKIFMGDSGSLTLGFIIAIIAIKSLDYIHPVTILYFTAIPLIDTIVVMIRRKNLGRSPFEADKTHIHHLLYEFFNSSKKTTLFLVMTQSIFCFLGYVVARHIEHFPKGLFPLAMLVSFVILTTMAYMVFTTMLKNKER